MGVLTGKSALVTGGSRGIGRAVVERLARDGAKVTFSYVSNADEAQKVVAFVEQLGGQAWAVRADQAKGDDIIALFDAAERNGDGLDIVVNNAGIGEGCLLLDTSDDDWHRTMNVNAFGTYRSIREAGSRLRDGGRIINLSSVNTWVASPGIGLYAASKAAIEQLSSTAAHEFGGRQITVNVVSPGATDTDLLRAANTEESLAGVPAETPLGRLGEPADIADAIAFLAGPDGRWITGQNLRVSGGL